MFWWLPLILMVNIITILSGEVTFLNNDSTLASTFKNLTNFASNICTTPKDFAFYSLTATLKPWVPHSESGGELDDNNFSVNDYSETFINVKLISMVVIVILGVLFNTCSLVIIIKQDLIKMGIWCYIACLSICDNFVLVMWLVFEISREPVNYIGKYLDNSYIFCKFVYIAYAVPLVASNNILACLTIERALTVIKPYRQPPNQKHAFIVVACIMIYSMLVNIPYYSIVFGIENYPIGINDPISGEPITINVCTKFLKEYVAVSIDICP